MQTFRGAVVWEDRSRLEIEIRGEWKGEIQKRTRDDLIYEKSGSISYFKKIRLKSKIISDSLKSESLQQVNKLKIFLSLMIEYRGKHD